MMKSMLTIAAAFAATSAAQELATDAMLVDFNGGSGSFKIFGRTPDSNKSKTFWNINYQKLYEVDSTGKRINSRTVSHVFCGLVLRAPRSLRLILSQISRTFNASCCVRASSVCQ
jgi:hypothetical protein